MPDLTTDSNYMSTGSTVNLDLRRSTVVKPPLGTAKHIYKKIGSLYDSSQKSRAHSGSIFTSLKVARELEATVISEKLSE